LLSVELVQRLYVAASGALIVSVRIVALLSQVPSAMAFSVAS
jgi:hypothetical protein